MVNIFLRSSSVEDELWKTTWQIISLPWCFCYLNITFTFTPLSSNCSIYHCPKSLQDHPVTKLTIELDLRPANYRKLTLKVLGSSCSSRYSLWPCWNILAMCKVSFCCGRNAYFLLIMCFRCIKIQMYSSSPLDSTDWNYAWVFFFIKYVYCFFVFQGSLT